MSELYIYNAARERIGILQHVESIQWLECYQEPGEVKIVARSTPDNIAMLIDGNRLYNTDSNTVARISHKDILESEAEETITVRADLTAELLEDRVVMATEIITIVETGMRNIYSKNRRGLPIELGAAGGYTDRLETAITWNSVLDAFVTLAKSSGLGFFAQFNPDTAVETLRIYKGVDRSRDSTAQYIGYFGTDVGNIFNVGITSGTTNYKNVAVVAGEGEGANRIVRIVSLKNVTGENRRELYADARDLQRESQVATDTGKADEKGNPIFEYKTKIYTEAEYNALLDARGYEKLAEQLIDFGITCDIEQTNIRFGVDYFLGDRVPVKLPEYGIYASAVISSVTRIYEVSGHRLIAILNNFTLEGYT